MTFGNLEIKTHFDHPPIPCRGLDWSAWIDGQEAWKTGRGQTELEAMLDLHSQLVDDGVVPELKAMQAERESLAAKDREIAAERPACAAIKYGPIILSGHRHSDCLSMAHLLGLKKTEGQQGFMTTLGRFVDRKEALALFVASGRVSADPQGLKPTTELYSEDLY